MARSFDKKIKIGEIRKLSIKELVLGILEPLVRSGERIRVWFVDGKIFFYTMEHQSGIVVTKSTRYEYGSLVERTNVHGVYYIEVDEYKRYITVKLSGEINFLQNLKDASGEDAIIPIIAHGETTNLPLSAILKKLRKQEARG